MTNHLFDALQQGRDSSNGELFISAGSELELSDDAFFSLSAQIATLLINTGVKPGDRIAVQVTKSVEALALYVACLRIGAVFLPLNTAYTSNEIGYFLSDATPAVFVCNENPEEASPAVEGVPSIFTLSAEGQGTLIGAAKQCAPMQETVARAPEDLAAILYTSGTTGRSKGAMLTHGNLLSNTQTLQKLWQFTERDVLLHALPIFHTHGLFVASNLMLLCGGRMIFQQGFFVDNVLQALPKATAMMGVPTFYTRLLADKRFTQAAADHMRLFISGSAPLLADTHQEFEARTGQRILERYGMTETNMNTSNPFDGERIAGTVGQALPGVEIRVCDADSQQALATNEVGVLHVRGPNVFKGYWKMPEKTREELLDDGFFITGDLATIDDRGYVTIVGRSKDLIISGGYNIYPKEVELLIDELSGVAESAVIGVPHTDFGEAVVAVVVLQTGSQLSVIDEKSVIDQLDGQLARFKLPKRVVFVDELPRNTMGKVQKNSLRDYWSTQNLV